MHTLITLLVKLASLLYYLAMPTALAGFALLSTITWLETAPTIRRLWRERLSPESRRRRLRWELGPERTRKEQT